MNIHRALPLVSFALAECLLGSVLAVRAQQPDNSAQNKGQTTTAQSQSNAKSDRLLAAQVRKAIIADKGLSTYAHNVKIVVVNGSVTLKGPVKSDEERQKVQSDVASVVSSSNIANQLTVKQ
jgi:hyperosmotically inducible protein